MKGNNNELQVAAVFATAIEANIAKGMLSAHGIESVLQGEIINSVMAIYMPSVDGIRLMVRPQDLDEATRLMKESGDIPQ